MKKIVLKFGIISGVILGTFTAIMVPVFCMKGKMDYENSVFVGYTAMVLSYLTVFFGIRRYRETVGGGTITFGRAFVVGILITLVTCAIYVTAWEIVYWGFIPDFGDKYAAVTLEKLRASGASDQKILEETQKMAEFKEMYKNPIFNIGMTFIEVFPVGLVVTLISAAILRRKTPPQPAMATA